jgi:hypothetical protein
MPFFYCVVQTSWGLGVNHIMLQSPTYDPADKESMEAARKALLLNVLKGLEITLLEKFNKSN